MDQWLRNRMTLFMFKDISSFSSSGHFVQQSRIGCVILVECYYCEEYFCELARSWKQECV